MWVVAVVWAIATEARPATIAKAVTSLVIISIPPWVVACVSAGKSNVAIRLSRIKAVRQGPRQSTDAVRTAESPGNQKNPASTWVFSQRPVAGLTTCGEVEVFGPSGV